VAKQLYGSDNSKLSDFALPVTDIDSSLDELEEAALDLQATQMAEQPLTALKLVRLAEFVHPSEWVRPLSEWEPPPMPEAGGGLRLSQLAELEKEHAERQFDSLVRHLLLRYDDAPRALLNSFAPFHGLALAQHWARAESPFLSEDNWLLCYRFARVLVAVGAGQSAVKALKASVSPKLSKQMAHQFMQTPAEVESPVHALRGAQVRALGGSAALEAEACRSSLGYTLGTEEHEEFAQGMLLWMCDREGELENVSQAALMDHLLARYEGARLAGKPFAMKGKTVNSVLKSARGVHELFYPSGLRSMRFPGADEAGAPCTVAVEEVLSADRLHEVGVAMGNCLQTARGIYKYTARARSRASSFWVVSYAYGGDQEGTESFLATPDPSEGAGGDAEGDGRRYGMIFEVWNQSRIVHQAEGPRSSIPQRAALEHMRVWSEAQGVDWTTWEVW